MLDQQERSGQCDDALFGRCRTLDSSCIFARAPLLVCLLWWASIPVLALHSAADSNWIVWCCTVVLRNSRLGGDIMLSVVGRIYARIVSDRQRVLTDSIVMDGQGGFRAGKGCVSLCCEAGNWEGDLEGQGGVCSICILEKAYDSC